MNQLIFLLGIIFSFSSVESHAQKSEKNEKIKSEYPSEWLYNQRAYPSGKIDREAIREATAITIAAKNQNKNLNATWQLEGPVNIGGRITDIAISPENDDHFYIGTSVGGVFKTTDRGQ